jgi:photosystem II stability/assembly factor-like uncharacterized protein
MESMAPNRRTYSATEAPGFKRLRAGLGIALVICLTPPTMGVGPRWRPIEAPLPRVNAALALRALPGPSEIPANAFGALRWRSVGPNRGGRSIAVAGSASRPNEYYFGATGGGVWKSTNGGATWFPVGDGQFRSSSVGAIGVCEANPDVVYVGFGEVQLRGDVIPGDGVYRTTDGGRTWTHLGLASSTGQQMVGRVRVDPANCDLVFAAVLGDGFGPNEERGIFRSKDGGRTWQKVLYRNERAGSVDLAVDPHNSAVLYAGFWEVSRKPWLLSSGGDGSGLFKSTDGGETWTELTDRPGLPTKPWGTVGISVSGVDSNRIYAIIEAADGGVFVSDDAGATWRLGSSDPNLRSRPFYYNRLTADPRERDVVYVYTEGFWRSRDAGRTWEEIEVPHGDNHDLWIDPKNDQRMIEANDGGANVSVDAGRTWTGLLYPTAQIYSVSTTAHFPYHICGPQQDNTSVCVPSDGDGTWWYSVGGGESGWVVPHPTDPAIYYASAQTSELTRLDRRTGQLRNIQPWPIRTVGKSANEVRERFQWSFPIAVSPLDPEVLYAGSQHLWKTTNRGRSWERISPDLTYADPTTLGPSGGPITLDRTTVEHYATIFAIAPSRHDAGTIWVGSDDGRVHITRDGGGHWTEITPTTMAKFSRVHFIGASPHKPGKAYLAVTRYEMQDVHPYVLRTEDYGRSWVNAVNGIRDGDHVRAVVEDPVREGLLFAGTENGVYVSLDDGSNWQSLQLNLPVSPVYSLTVKDNDLVVATHGRSFWVLDDITPLRQLTGQVIAARAHVFRPAAAIRTASRPTEGDASYLYRRTGPLGSAHIYYYLREPAQEVTVEILNEHGDLVRVMEPGGRRKRAAAGTRVEQFGMIPSPDGPPPPPTSGRQAGLNLVLWDLRYPGPTTFPGMLWRFAGTDGPMAPPGNYQVRLTVDGQMSGAEPFHVGMDPRLPATAPQDYDEQFRLAMQIRDKTSLANETVILIRAIKQQVEDRLKRSSDAALKRTADSFTAKISEIESQIYSVRLRAPGDELNFGLKLNNDLAVLLLEVESGDGRPNAQENDAFKYLSEQLDLLLEKLDTALERDMAQLNRLLERQKLPPVTRTVGPSK